MTAPSAEIDAHPSLRTDPAAPPVLSVLLIHLLKGVLHREDDEGLWSRLLFLQAQVRAQAGILLLDLVIDEAEGYAFLKARPDADGESQGPRPPRLIARRPLTYPVSLMLALLRRKLAESDASGTDLRVILTRDDIVEMIRIFLPEASNEARLVDQVDATLNKVIELGFARRLKSAGGASHGPIEVRRILKAFVDAQWLADFDERLALYRSHALQGTGARQMREASDE